MTLITHTSDDSRVVTISVQERFDFSVHQHFREAYANCNDNSTEFVLDLAKTTYMDSSALGMILLLKDHAEKLSGSIKIINPSESVRKILEIAQFHRLMTIDS